MKIRNLLFNAAGDDRLFVWFWLYELIRGGEEKSETFNADEFFF